MKKGNKVAMVGGSGAWNNLIYTIRCVTNDGTKVRLNQAVGGKMWQDIKSVRLATKAEARLGYRDATDVSERNNLTPSLE